MKNYILILLAMLLPLTVCADYTQGSINVTVNGSLQTAVARIDGTNHKVVLGNGYNSCIPYWTEGQLTIPGSVNISGTDYQVEVGPVAFRLCNGLTKITIDEGVQTIGDYAFVGCSSVTEVNLPSTLTSIERGAFVNMASLKIVTSKATAAPAWHLNDVFSSTGTKEGMAEMAASRILYVPEGSCGSYLSTKYDGSARGWETVGWQEAFTRIYELNDDPQEITSLQDLKDFRDAVNDGTQYKGSNNKMVTLTTDLDLSSIDKWTPIGTLSHPFDGIFNGGGHVIKNLKVDRAVEYNGLFGYAENATIYNMHLKNPSVSGSDYQGTVLGYAHGNTHLSDILVTGTDYIVAGSGSVGGIVGYASNATIERCMFYGKAQSTGWIGGIVGNVYNNVIITDCAALNQLWNSKNESSTMGGIVGGAGSVTVSRCYARTGFLDIMSVHVKGNIVGKTNRNEESTITNCAYWSASGGSGLIGLQEGESTLSESGNKYYAENDMKQDGIKDVLGEDNWYYFTGNYIDYPVPSTLKDMYLANCIDEVDGGFTYRPAGKGDASYEIVKYTGSATSLTIPDTYNGKPVTAILDGVFKDNPTLASLTIGSNITSIGASAFENCDALTSVILPNAVTDVGEDAFVGCDNLTSFTIGTGFANHKGNFLAYCPKLATITVADGNTNNYSSVDNVLIHNTDYGSYVVVCAPGKTGDYTIPTENLTNTYVWIMGNCFASCNGLTSITFPEDKQYKLDGAVFDEAYNLRYVDMSNVTGFINNDRTATTVNVSRSDTDNSFYGMSECTIVYLPAGNSAAQGEANVVIGGNANSIELIDGWDFNPPVTITTTGAVSLRRTLRSKSVIYATTVTDESGNPVYPDDDEKIPLKDKDGNPMYEEDGVTPKYLPKMTSEERFEGRGYTVYLPYALTLTAENAKVYAPTTIATNTGVTTVTFNEVRDKEMAAYTPYYIVVEGEDAVKLSTTDATTIATPPVEEPSPLDGFMFKGTTVKIPNSELYDAEKPTYLLQSDDKWHKVPNNQPRAYIGPFRAYFQAVGASGTRILNMAFGQDETTAIAPVVRTIDADGTERYYDMNGCQLNGKPQKGMYIHNGKKHINK